MKTVFNYISLLAVIALFSSKSYSQLQGNSLHFDGTNDIVNCGLPPLFANIPTQDFTMEAWLKPQATVFCRVIFAQPSTSNFATFSLGTSNQIYFYVVSNGTTYSSVTTTTLPLNTWSHVACQWNAATNVPNVFINGVMQTISGGGGSSTGTNGQMTIGSRPGGFQFFQGELDEVRIWNSARSQCQIAGAMNSRLTGSETGLVAYYDFDNGVGGSSNPGITNLPDLTTNAFNGTLANFALSGSASNWLVSGANISMSGPAANNTQDSTTICTGDTLVFGTKKIDTAGTYVELFTTPLGCDSTVTLKVDVLPAFSGTATASFCSGENYIFGSQVLNSAGMYTEAFTDMHGCDSVIDLTLNMTIIDKTIVPIASSLKVSANGAMYQWLDCNDNMAPISGATSQTFKPTVNGNYAVKIIQNFCVDTSACVAVQNVGIISQAGLKDIRVFPNPFKNTLSVSNDFSLDQLLIEMTDLTGKTVVTKTLQNVDEYQLDLSGLPKGTYILHLQSREMVRSYKVMKE